MKHLRTLTAAFVCASLPSQVQVSVSGTLTISYQPSYGGVVTNSQLVHGSATLASSGVGTSALAIGAHTALTVTADSPPFGCYGCWSAARGDAVLEFSSPVPIAGLLRLDVGASCLMNPPFVDVEDDGAWEAFAGGPQNVDVPVVVGADPLPVRISAETVNFGGATCSYAVTVTFLPLAAGLRVHNPPCGPALGASLTGSPSPSRLNTRVGPTNAPLGALAIGGTPVGRSPTCAAVAPPAAAVLLVPGANGVEYSIPLSPALLGTFSLQYFEFDPTGQMRLSNGLVLVLP